MASREVMKIDWQTKKLIINPQYLDDYQINYYQNEINVAFKYQNKAMDFVLIIDDRSYRFRAEFEKQVWKIDCDFLEHNDPDWINNWETKLALKLD